MCGGGFPSFLRSFPSFLRRQEPARPNPSTPNPLLSPFPNSSLPPLGGRLGGGWEVASGRRPLFYARNATSVVPAPQPSFLRPISSFLRRQEPTQLNPQPPRHPSSLSPIHPSPLRHFCAPVRHSCGQFRHSCVGRNGGAGVAVRARVPACAGMTEGRAQGWRGVGARELRRERGAWARALVDDRSLPPPIPACAGMTERGRGGGMNWGGGVGWVERCDCARFLPAQE